MTEASREWRNRKIRDLVLFGCIFAVVAFAFAYRFFRVPQLEGEGASFGLPVSETTEEQPLFTAVSAYPFVSDLLKEVGGSFVDVRTVSQDGRGGSGTGFSAEQFDLLKSAQLIVLLDERVDGWMGVPVADGSARIMRLRDGVRELPFDAPYISKRNRPEEYFWLSPDEMDPVIRHVARVFGEIDPVHKVQYLDHAYALLYKLDDLSQRHQDALRGSKQAYSVLGYGFFPLLEQYDLRLGTRIIAENRPVSEVIQLMRKRLSDHPEEFVVTDVSFPVSSSDMDAGMRKRIIFLDPYGQLFAKGSYIDFLEENMRRLE